MRRSLVVLFTLVLLYAPAAHAWSWPTGGPDSILRGFSFNPADPHAPGQHPGIDVAGSLGAPVFAPAPGTVVFGGTVPSGGKTVTIRTPDGYTATVRHLGATAVRRGTVVQENQLIGVVGSSGADEHDEPYVHFSVRVTAEPYGFVDPLELLRIERS
jgi:murein DD-endopeptidase MepM/ murein hydrolase activator NlpD